MSWFSRVVMGLGVCLTSATFGYAIGGVLPALAGLGLGLFVSGLL